MVKLQPLDPEPILLACIELRPLSGEPSNGHIIEVQGRASETLVIAFNRGPLSGRRFQLGPLPRDNRDLSKPVDLDMLGTICRVSGPAGP